MTFTVINDVYNIRSREQDNNNVKQDIFVLFDGVIVFSLWIQQDHSFFFKILSSTWKKTRHFKTITPSNKVFLPCLMVLLSSTWKQDIFKTIIPSNKVFVPCLMVLLSSTWKKTRHLRCLTLLKRITQSKKVLCTCLMVFDYVFLPIVTCKYKKKKYYCWILHVKKRMFYLKNIIRIIKKIEFCLFKPSRYLIQPLKRVPEVSN